MNRRTKYFNTKGEVITFEEFQEIEAESLKELKKQENAIQKDRLEKSTQSRLKAKELFKIAEKVAGNSKDAKELINLVCFIVENELKGEDFN